MGDAQIANYISGGVGLINLGVVAYIVRLVVGPMRTMMNELSKSVNELYESRNLHALDIEHIKTVHKIRGCECPDLTKTHKPGV